MKMVSTFIIYNNDDNNNYNETAVILIFTNTHDAIKSCTKCANKQQSLAVQSGRFHIIIISSGTGKKNLFGRIVKEGRKQSEIETLVKWEMYFEERSRKGTYEYIRLMTSI